jgi:hypothetical protein
MEGYGEMIEKNGKLMFKDISALRFSGGFVLQQAECSK